MKLIAFLICCIKGHKAFLLTFAETDVYTFNYCRRCGQRVRTFHTPTHWYEVSEEKKEAGEVSPMY